MSVVGAAPRASTASEVIWDLEAQPSRSDSASNRPSLIVRATSNDEEHEYVRARGAGIYELGIRTARASGGESKTPYGRIVWIGQDSQ